MTPDQALKVIRLSPPTLANYVDVFDKNKMLQYFWNSVLVTGGAVVTGLLVGVPAGYGIARSNAAKAAILILIARMTPALSYLIPLFLLFQVTGLVGSIAALVITHLVITVPIIVWVMIGYFEGVPVELEDAAHYGRVVRKRGDLVERIVEAADATDREKEICEINVGC